MSGRRTGTRARRRTVVATAASDELAGLDVAALRDCRHHLEAEVDRVSYWHSLVAARLGALEAGARTDRPLAVADLLRVLGDTATGRTRRALAELRPTRPLPALPDPAATWPADVDPDDRAAAVAAADLLHGADSLLAAYLRALEQHLEDVTAELILRYRADPLVALTLIPEG